MARLLERSTEAAFLDLIPLLPEEYRPLLRALIDENNELLLRVQQRARQNHLLLNRSLDLMQRFINTLAPGSRMPTYDGMGNLFPAALGARPIYEAVG
jgi:flagellar biosynthesis/type III secretory pathway chaperone